jgi:cell division septum initiation protein DivIVA
VEYSYWELREFLDTVEERIEVVRSQMEELEDVMNSGDEQIALDDRLDRLLEKRSALVEAMSEAMEREYDDD